MLRISKLADYGTVIMVYLARHPQMLCAASDIAAQTRLSLPTVSKLLKRLTSAGLLRSVRGVAGGYRLERSAADISVAEIIYALEAQRGLTECSVHAGSCALEGVCHVQGNWRLISQAIEQALGSVSLEALARPVLSTVEVERIRHFARGVERG
ncbi:rrf2 family transporter protein [Legionella geestiana]|uniref:Rrf2 family transporter protein n=1 Tax=Legionella geestiana TaxID=45065 RepID=A0A0W0U7M4_9GAMM|nr:SUF system Fe-S cluster assembly regulator [Legionella geestiana]KTD03813.1 rrf2 family transporter protein [Legionella geestiana]QBS11903.1 SUF system Fe-S cluster assembly regulator [Legionella geestiana]QDQ40485.1 SUF system Fe-S cluster assembly regulator [Legionella geestiana]STX53388.1 rrf2 family protein [Legionella geestiana]